MTSPSDAAAQRPVVAGLFAGLVDDAAVFPPGNAPLPEAVRLHRRHRASGYAACVGPLLVPVASAAEVACLAAGGPTPLRVGLVARPGVPLGDVERALAELRASADVEVVGVEFGWSPPWRDAALDGVALTVEVPRAEGLDAAVTDLARGGAGTTTVQAKFRTGATDTWAWPDERELATVLRTMVDHDLAFKLTGGLHHVVRGTWDGQDQHGLLNVLVAVRAALDGSSADELIPLLSERDVTRLLPRVTRMSAPDVAAVRSSFTAYGCCEVTDPIGELSALHLLEES
jgi:hypothetical protein